MRLVKNRACLGNGYGCDHNKCLLSLSLFSRVVLFWDFEIITLQIGRVVSSPEHNVLRVSYCDRSMYGVCPFVHPSVNNYLKNLLSNRPTDFNETSQKYSLDDALSENFKDVNSVKNSGCHGNQKRKFKNLLVSNREG